MTDRVRLQPVNRRSHDVERVGMQAGSGPALDAATPREAARIALDILLSQQPVFGDPPIAMGPRPLGTFAEALGLLGDPAPAVAVHCSNYEGCGGRRICRWTYDQNWSAINPVHRSTKAWTRGAPYWLDRANAGKGPVQTAGGRAGKHDGNGTHNYKCRCGRNIPVTAERRFRLYLEAVAKGRTRISI
jgi:hypothetical protein